MHTPDKIYQSTIPWYVCKCNNYLINFIFLHSSSIILTIAEFGATGIISGCNVVLFIVRVKNLPFPKLLLSVMLIQREALVSPSLMLT